MLMAKQAFVKHIAPLTTLSLFECLWKKGDCKAKAYIVSLLTSIRPLTWFCKRIFGRGWKNSKFLMNTCMPWQGSTNKSFVKYAWGKTYRKPSQVTLESSKGSHYRLLFLDHVLTALTCYHRCILWCMLEVQVEMSLIHMEIRLYMLDCFCPKKINT